MYHVPLTEERYNMGGVQCFTQQASHEPRLIIYAMNIVDRLQASCRTQCGFAASMQFAIHEKYVLNVEILSLWFFSFVILLSPRYVRLRYNGTLPFLSNTLIVCY